MLTLIRTSFCGLALIALAAGCSPNADRKGGAKEYAIVGKVTAIAEDKSTAALDHEAIPGLMQAMEMKFRLANAEVVKDIQVGDSVKGKLSVKDGGYTILNLAKATPAAAPNSKAAKIQADLAKLDPKDRALAESQVKCPVTGGLLGSMGVPPKLMVGGQPVFVCCDGCNEEATADPAKTLAKIESFRKK